MKSTLTSKEIAEAFARIEDELIASMIKNFERHQVAQVLDGMEWSMWQAEQLKSLHDYTTRNAKKYGKEFDKLNKQIEDEIAKGYRSSKAEAYREIDRALKKGWDGESFFAVPSERLDALIAATHSDMMKAEYATLRKASDIYRTTIFDAQVYASSGAGTYAQAIDMATKDFLAKGIDGIVYKNGSQHTIREYSQMAVRTATKRAAFVAEGDARKEWDVHTVIVDYRNEACPECMEWVGQVLIDDVYSGGSSKEAKELDYPLLSEAMDAGLFHPNCQDTMSTYFPDITEIPERPSKDAQGRAEAREEVEQLENQAMNNEARYERLANYSLDPENTARYEAKAQEWGERAEAVSGLERSALPTFDEFISDNQYLLDGSITPKYEAFMNSLIEQKLNSDTSFQIWLEKARDYGNAHVVSHAELDKIIDSGATMIFRGMPDSARTTGVYKLSQVMNEAKYYAGNGIYGDGLYFSTQPEMAVGYAAGSDAKHTGAIMKAALVPDAKVGDYFKLHPIFLEEINDIPGALDSYGNFSAWARTKGYDAIHNANMGIINVLNRDAIVMADEIGVVQGRGIGKAAKVTFSQEVGGLK